MITSICIKTDNLICIKTINSNIPPCWCFEGCSWLLLKPLERMTEVPFGLRGSVVFHFCMALSSLLSFTPLFSCIVVIFIKSLSKIHNHSKLKGIFAILVLIFPPNAGRVHVD